MNRRIDIRDTTIYAVLTDTKQWEFLAYDGAQQKFYRDEPMCLSGQPLEDHWLYIRSMIQGKLLLKLMLPVTVSFMADSYMIRSL